VPHPCCVSGFGPQMSSQGCTGHAPSFSWLPGSCAVDPGLFVGAVVCRSLLAPLSNAPPRIAVICGVSCFQVAGAEYATPSAWFRRRWLPTAHTDCSELWIWLCTGFSTDRQFVRVINHLISYH